MPKNQENPPPLHATWLLFDAHQGLMIVVTDRPLLQAHHDCAMYPAVMMHLVLLGSDDASCPSQQWLSSRRTHASEAAQECRRRRRLLSLFELRAMDTRLEAIA
jgi:hypothetical protein